MRFFPERFGKRKGPEVFHVEGQTFQRGQQVRNPKNPRCVYFWDYSRGDPPSAQIHLQESPDSLEGQHTGKYYLSVDEFLHMQNPAEEELQKEADEMAEEVRLGYSSQSIFMALEKGASVVVRRKKGQGDLETDWILERTPYSLDSHVEVKKMDGAHKLTKDVWVEDLIDWRIEAIQAGV